MNTFSLFIITLLIAAAGVKYWLNQRQIQHVLRHRDTVPAAFAESISLQAHQKAADYTVAKTRLANFHGIISLLVVLGFTFGGGIDALANILFDLIEQPIVAGTTLILLVFLVSHLIELPLSIYQTFQIETRFGFNRSTPIQFLKDQGLQMVLMVLIGAPLLAAILAVMGHAGSFWWLAAWALVMAFSMLMTWAYPLVLAPLFNTFSPLPDSDLKTRIHALLDRCGFNSNGIFVMDGSRRSGHGNAYFTGIGKNKRIVFFDTLLETLEPDEIEAVLAHELGHFKCKHVTKHLWVSAGLTLLGFALLGWLAQQSWFYAGLGVRLVDPATALLLFILILPVATLFIKPLSSAAQRKFEFEADDFASETANTHSLIQALVKLYRDNASTLTPDPLYSGFHHSHPPASVRIGHLSDTIKPLPQ